MSVAALVVRGLPIPNVASLLIAVGSPYALIAGVAALLLALLCRRAFLSLVAAVVVVAGGAVQASWYYVGGPVDVGPHVEIRVLSSNLRLGRADAEFLVNLVDAEADVIAVSELTPEELHRLRRAGIESVFPNSVLHPAPGPGGIGLWSRYPLTLLPTSTEGFHPVAARAHVPGVRFDPVVASIHITSPVWGKVSFADWERGITNAQAELADLADAAGVGAVIVGGDFNSTPDMRQFRDLLSVGYRDAVAQTGAGWGPTFPADSWFPPLITIDHVLTRQAAATAIKTVKIPGSDHRALLSTIAVPLDPTTS